MREVHGVVKGDNRVLVQDDADYVRIQIGDRWQQVTPDEALFVSRLLTKSAARVKRQSAVRVKKQSAAAMDAG